MPAPSRDASHPQPNRLLGLFAGQVRPLGPNGEPSGIVKHALTGPVQIRALGLEGDAQADSSVHGGVDKAIHQYAAEHYATLRATFPEQASLFGPGAMGENLSAHGMTESTVCIGDVYRVGDAVLQVSQPRSPCWKIDARFGRTGVMRFVFERAITGWYYRVLRPGAVRVGDPIELVRRNTAAVSLATLWAATHASTPTSDELATLETTPGLSENWAKKLARKRREHAAE